MAVQRVKLFSISEYVVTALALADYDRDGDGLIVATILGASGFFAQGQNHEDARANLEDAIEGNALLALQLGWEIPTIPSVAIEERDVEPRPLSPAEVIRRLRRLGFEGPIGGGCSLPHPPGLCQ